MPPQHLRSNRGSVRFFLLLIILGCSLYGAAIFTYPHFKNYQLEQIVAAVVKDRIDMLKKDLFEDIQHIDDTLLRAKLGVRDGIVYFARELDVHLEEDDVLVTVALANFKLSFDVSITRVSKVDIFWVYEKDVKHVLDSSYALTLD